MMLDVRRLRLLRELAHRGTIASVAEALAYSPSAVSQQLAALEREAGVPLLARSGRRVVLTPAGVTLAGYAESVLALLEEASAALAATRGMLPGPLRIGAFPTAVRTVLPAALAELGRDHPALELMVAEIDPADVPAAVRGGTLDVALVHDYDHVPVEPDPALDTEPLAVETIYLASAGPLAGPAGDPVGRCRDQPWIVGSPGTLCHTMTVRACQAAGFTPRIRHYADDFAAVLALVATGQGVSLVPELGAVEPVPGVTLTPLAVRRHTRIAYRKGAGQHPAVRAFTAAIRTATAAFASITTPPGSCRSPGAPPAVP
jgi:DNA-binding transcriptional LysR family regulator